MAKLEAVIQVRTRAARMWISIVVLPVSLLFGRGIGRRVGIWGAWRLARWRMGTRGPWRRFDRELHEATARDYEERRR